MFIAANFEEVENDDNPDKELCRYEFMEIIVRIADHKYLKKGSVKSLSEGVDKLLKSVLSNFNAPPW